MIASSSLPLLALRSASAGAGLTIEQLDAAATGGLTADFIELRAEECMGDGGPLHRLIRQIRQRYPLALRDVGLSVGSDQPPDRTYLLRLRNLVDRYQPSLLSEPLAWSTHDGICFGEPLPLPYTDETLGRVCSHVEQAQRAVGMCFLLENPRVYLRFAESSMTEGEFLRRVVVRTGCSLLLDVTAAYVSALNQEIEPMDMIDTFPIEHVRAMRLGGFRTHADDDGAPLLIDDRGVAVPDPVWAIYRRVLARSGPLPTMINAAEGGTLACDLARAGDTLEFEARRRARQLHS